MNNQKVRLFVMTNTNIRFITVLPSSYSISRALPLLFDKYRAVVSENLGQDNHLLQCESISNLTKKGCLIARDEIVADVLSENDEVRVEIKEGGGIKDVQAQGIVKSDKQENLLLKKHLKGIL